MSLDRRRRRPDRRILHIGAIAVVTLLALGIPALVAFRSRQSSASFADAEVLGTNRLGAAVLDLEIVSTGGTGSVATSTGGTVDGPTEAVFGADNLAPGDSVSGQLEVANLGDLPFRFGLSAVGDGSILGDWLRYETWVGTGTCAPDQPGRRLARDVAIESTPTVLVPVGRAATEAALILEPGQSVVLCLGATLPLAAPNEVQARSTEVTLVVAAEQLPEVER